MNFTFLHCADIHLGSPMSGLALKDAAVAEKFAAACRESFADLVTRAIAEKVAFALIAGDLYDGDWQDNGIGLFFNRQAARLARADIPVYLIKGNHDAESVVTRTIPLPDNVIQFSTRRAETHELPALKVAIHGRSFPDRAVNENWAVDYPAPRAGWLNIGMLHTSCEGNAKHATYAPCSVAELVARGYDYWALGHVHAYQELHRDPWIVYPGNTQGRSVRETGEKGAVFVDVVDGRIDRVRREIVDRARWVEAIIDISSAATTAEALAKVGADLRPLLVDARGRAVAARVRLVGETTLDHALRAGRSQLFDDVLALAQQIHDDAWLEKLSLETIFPTRATAGHDLSSIDLDAMIADCVDDPNLRRRALEAVGQIAAKLPGEATRDDTPLAEDMDALIAEARAIVLARAGA